MVVPPGTTEENTSCLYDERKLEGRSLTYMSELRIGVIGTGMMGCEHLRNLVGITNVAVTAISDPHEEQQRWARHTLGDQASGVAEFTDHRDLLSSGLVDAVLVASPNFTHKSLLDDIFDKLDEKRITRLLEFIDKQHKGQVFITDARPERTKSFMRRLTRDVSVISLE